MGMVRVTSAVYSSADSIPMSNSARSPSRTGPELSTQCSVQAWGPHATMDP